jgi:hypothetical protein
MLSSVPAGIAARTPKFDPGVAGRSQPRGPGKAEAVCALHVVLGRDGTLARSRTPANRVGWALGGVGKLDKCCTRSSHPVGECRLNGVRAPARGSGAVKRGARSTSRGPRCAVAAKELDEEREANELLVVAILRSTRPAETRTSPAAEPDAAVLGE